MRILTVTRGFYPAVDFGGPAIAGFELGRRLVQRGHEVTVYTSNLYSADRKLYPRSTERDVAGMRVVYLNSVWHYNYAAVTPDVFGFCRREIHDFDVVNVYGLREFLTIVVTGFARRAGVPYVLQPLGNLPRYTRSTVLKTMYDALFRRRLLHGAARVLGRSELEGRQIQSAGVPADRVAVVPNGVDLDSYRGGNGPAFRRRFGLGADEKIILYLGRLATIKSLDMLVDAFAPLATMARLVLAGPPVEPIYVEQLRGRIAALGITGRVTFTGALDGRDKVDAYTAADIFVLPSVVETYGLAAAEAIASGTPVIVTTGCGLAPVVHDKAGLAVLHDTTNLRRAIQCLLTNDELRTRLAEGCRTIAKDELSWGAAVDQLEAVLAQAARDGRQRERADAD